MGKVYGLENKKGYFYDFVKNTFAVWSYRCALPSEELAENILLLYSDSDSFNEVKVVPVPVSD